MNLLGKLLKIGQEVLAELLCLTNELLAKDFLRTRNSRQVLDDVETVAERPAGALAGCEDVNDQPNVLNWDVWRLQILLLLLLVLAVTSGTICGGCRCLSTFSVWRFDFGSFLHRDV